MVAPRLGILLAAGCALACGDRPDLPGPALSRGVEPSRAAAGGSGSASGSLDRPSVDEVAQPADAPPPAPRAEVGAASEADAGPAPLGDEDAEEAPAPVGPAPSATACTDDGGNCLLVNIAVNDTSADSCIQLALDNCESSPQAGLRVDLPVSWRLGAASISPASEECVPGAPFNPMDSTTIIAASGSIGWNLTTRVPSELVLDVTLEPASTALETVRLTNSDLVEPLAECE